MVSATAKHNAQFSAGSIILLLSTSTFGHTYPMLPNRQQVISSEKIVQDTVHIKDKTIPL